MKKLIALALCIATLFLLVSCRSAEETNAPDDGPVPSGQTEETGNDQTDDTHAEPALTDWEGEYVLCRYYKPGMSSSELYPELRARQDRTGEPMGTMVLRADGTGTAAYPGGSLELTWDEKDIYIDGRAMDVTHWFYEVILMLETGEEMTYSKLSPEDDYSYRGSMNGSMEETDPSDYSVSEPVVERFFDGGDMTTVTFAVTNNSDKVLVLDSMYYSVLSPSGAETDYRSLHASITQALLPGESGFFFEYTSDPIPEDAVLKYDKVFISEWKGEYERFEVTEVKQQSQELNNVILHRPTGTVMIPDGADLDLIELTAICYDADGRVIGYGMTVNTPSSVNPYNYLEIPESGGKASFMINMAGVFDDMSFDQSLIDHYEFRASSLNYFWY